MLCSHGHVSVEYVYPSGLMRRWRGWDPPYIAADCKSWRPSHHSLFSFKHPVANPLAFAMFLALIHWWSVSIFKGLRMVSVLHFNDRLRQLQGARAFHATKQKVFTATAGKQGV